MKRAAYGRSYESYARDESRFAGFFSEIAFPESEEELSKVLYEAYYAGLPVTIQGARTGVTGSGVPLGGLLLSTEKLRNIGPVEPDEGGVRSIFAEAGVRLSELEHVLARESCCFIPSPGEKSASLGGLFVNSTKGINQYKTRPFSSFFQEANLVLADGTRWQVHRGKYRFGPEGCPLPGGGFLRLSGYTARRPAPGFLPHLGQDLLDLFPASEGMLAAITGLRLRVSEKRGEPWALLFFFPGLKEALCFSSALKRRDALVADPNEKLSFLDIMDERSLTLLMENRGTIQRLRGIPDFPDHCGAAVYTELSGMDDGRAEARLLDVIECFEAMGGCEENSWAANGEAEVARLRSLRHALPEVVNMQADRQHPPGRILYVDVTLPEETLLTFAEKVKLDCFDAGLVHWLFGHVGEGRLHLALLVREGEETRSQTLAARWADTAISLGGNAMSENGVGKTRQSVFWETLSPRDQDLLIEIKAQLDPKGLLNPGNMLGAST